MRSNNLPALLTPRLTDRLAAAAALFTDWLGAARPRRAGSLQQSSEEFRQKAFTFALIALAVKLARSGGSLTRERFLTFREVFPIDDDASLKIRTLFRLAWRDGADAGAYARQIVYLYPERRPLWHEVMQRLCHIAAADGPVAIGELRQLIAVAEVFGFTRAQLMRMLSIDRVQRREDPLRVLGLSKKAKLEDIRSRYRQLMRRFHPDMLSGVQLPEGRAVAERKAAKISIAYRKALKRKRA